MLASQEGHTEIAKCLIEAKASLNLQTLVCLTSTLYDIKLLHVTENKLLLRQN